MRGAGNACPPACLPLVGTGGALPVKRSISADFNVD